jgi:hypothetical protein
VPILKAGLSRNLAATHLNPTSADLAEEFRLLLQFTRQVGPEALPELIEVAGSNVPDIAFRAQEAIQSIGKDAIPDLIKVLENDKVSSALVGVRRHWAEGLLGQIAVDCEYRKDLGAIGGLERASKIVCGREHARPLRMSREQRFCTTIQNAIQALKAYEELNDRWQWLQEVNKHPWVLLTIAIPAFLLGGWGIILWLKPLALVRLDSAMDLTGLTKKVFGWLPIRSNFLADNIIYPPRVLDAWVRRHAAAVREAFDLIRAVSTRRIAVPLPVTINGKPHGNCSADLLRPLFSGSQCYILIHGEGGAGKTTLAFQIASWGLADGTGSALRRHPMLPVLLDANLKGSVHEAVRGGLQLETKNGLSPMLVQGLLRHGRIMVIADGLSERDDVTRGAITPADPAFLATMLIVTSRKEEQLGNADLVRVTANRIPGASLTAFAQQYLERVGKYEAFEPSEFHYMCGDLSRLAGRLGVTALLAVLYLNLVVARKEGSVTGTELDPPRNVPELVLKYVNLLNKTSRDNTEVQKDAKILAWFCVRGNLQPGDVDIDIDDPLTQFARGDIEERVQYLREDLGLIANVGPNARRIRFVLDPVAEYLGARYVLEKAGQRPSALEETLNRLESFGPLAVDHAGFIIALDECIKAEPGRFGITAEQIARIERLVALIRRDSEEVSSS